MTPELAISLGDPAGIGPEITLRAASAPAVRRACRMVVYGDERLIELTRARLGRAVEGPSAITEIRHTGSMRIGSLRRSAMIEAVSRVRV